jgi:hypothetical protein
MGHQCDDCGETFETLSRLRLHDCDDVSDAGSATFGASGVSGLSNDRDGTVPDLDEHLAAVDENVDAVYRLVGVFDSALQTALDKDDGGETYRDVYWSYYEPVADALDDVVQRDGWATLVTLTDAYDPTTDEEVPLAAPVIENAIGRNIIRIRVMDSVEAIPPAVLSYLEDVVTYAGRADEGAREEAHTYGWAIGHPDHDVTGRILDAASAHPFWVQQAVEHAFYADQHLAVDVFERIVREETTDESVPGGSLARYMLDSVAGPDSEEFWPVVPRYWDWNEEISYQFEWDDDVEQRIRAVVIEADIDLQLSDDWSFQELMV